jgi:hypothetical protein
MTADRVMEDSRPEQSIVERLYNWAMCRNSVLAWLCTAAVIALIAAPAKAKDKDYVAPKAFHAKTYPANDAHDNERVAIAVDPYDLPDKTAGLFVIDYKDEGLLPLQLIISNDGDGPVSLTDMKVQLVTAKRVKIGPATPEDIYRKIARQPASSQSAPKPFPLPGKTVKRSVKKSEQDEIDNARFLARAVEPHATQAGFLFFDVEGIDHPLAGAHLYISGVRDNSGQELMFFDIPLEKYLTYQPGAKKD